LATVAIERHARRAEMDGADGLVVTGHEAAAHGAEIGTLVLVPLVARQTKLPIIAAGGFCDGRGLAAALVLGADAISMGTRLMLTQECNMHQKAKELSLKPQRKIRYALKRLTVCLEDGSRLQRPLKWQKENRRSFRPSPVPFR